MDSSPPGSSVHGDSPGKNTGVGCHDLLLGIFPTQGSNPGFPHCRPILYHLSFQGRPPALSAVKNPAITMGPLCKLFLCIHDSFVSKAPASVNSSNLRSCKGVFIFLKEKRNPCANSSMQFKLLVFKDQPYFFLKIKAKIAFSLLTNK